MCPGPPLALTACEDPPGEAIPTWVPTVTLHLGHRRCEQRKSKSSVEGKEHKSGSEHWLPSPPTLVSSLDPGILRRWLKSIPPFPREQRPPCHWQEVLPVVSPASSGKCGQGTRRSLNTWELPTAPLKLTKGDPPQVPCVGQSSLRKRRRCLGWNWATVTCARSWSKPSIAPYKQITQLRMQERNFLWRQKKIAPS